jgi:hypothetical protein
MQFTVIETFPDLPPSIMALATQHQIPLIVTESVDFDDDGRGYLNVRTRFHFDAAASEEEGDKIYKLFTGDPAWSGALCEDEPYFQSWLIDYNKLWAAEWVVAMRDKYPKVVIDYRDYSKSLR